jgi:hypothetical protein
LSYYDDHKLFDDHVPYDPGAGAAPKYIAEDLETDKLRYLFYGLLDNRILAELPISKPRFASKFKDSGNFSGAVILGDERLAKLDVLGATIPERTAVFIDFGGQLVWGGIIWGRTYNSDTKELGLSADEFGSFYERMYIDTNRVYTNVDQMDIARGIVIDVQQDKGKAADIGVIDNGETSTRTRKRTYHNYDFKQVWSALKQLSNVRDGFDFSFDVRWGVFNQPEKVLSLHYPFRGQTGDETNLLFDFPGNISKYEFPEDSSDNAMKTTAIGSGEGPAQITATAINQAYISAGYPQTETTYSYKDIIEQDTLQGHAFADLDHVSDRFEDLKITVPLLGDPRFGTYITGDEALVRIVDERFPQGLLGADGNPLSESGDAFMRIMGWEVDPTANQVTIELASPVVR